MVHRLARWPFKPERRVRLPYALPNLSAAANVKKGLSFFGGLYAESEAESRPDSLHNVFWGRLNFYPDIVCINHANLGAINIAIAWLPAFLGYRKHLQHIGSPYFRIRIDKGHSHHMIGFLKKIVLNN